MQGKDQTISAFNKKVIPIETLNNATDKQIHFVAFFLVNDLISVVIGVPTESIIIKGFSTRMTHYTISNGGSKLLHVSYCFIYEFVSRLAIYCITFLLSRLVLERTFYVDLVDFFSVFVFTTYDLVRLIFVSLIPTHVAQSFRRYRLMKKVIKKVILLLYGMVASQVLRLGEDLSTLKSHLSIILVGWNCYIQFLPHAPQGDKQDTAWEDLAGNVSGDIAWFFTLVAWTLVFSIILWLIVWWNWRVKECLIRLKREKNIKGSESYGLTSDEAEIEREQNLCNDLQNNSAVIIDQLKKVYDNGHVGFQGLSFTVKKGEVFSLIGPPGSGKSSLIETLSGVLQRTSGEVYYFGKQMDQYQNSGLSFSLDRSGCWEFLTFKQHVLLYAAWRGVEEEVVEKILINIDTVLLRDKCFNTKGKSLTISQKKVLQLILALFGNPTLLLCDEPTSGMELTQQRYFWQVLKMYVKSAQATMILTTDSFEEINVALNLIAGLDRQDRNNRQRDTEENKQSEEFYRERVHIYDVEVWRD
jgi:ABC-type multidrug transport system ATPase subunit